MGDYAFPCFRLAKAMRKAPPAIAEELRAGITLPSSITKAEVKGGYLNFFEDRAGAASATIKRVLAEGRITATATKAAARTCAWSFPP